ncbi:MAG: ferrochelatase [Acidimicrobiales bacterium]|nr:ferrochelatase [Acidimicrobiales bacterium]MBO0894718.1 ferrochelatase [Acidimicrobiales bacterium]
MRHAYSLTDTGRTGASFGDARYDAVVVVSFGGPEGPDDVLPFLEHVTEGRGVPAARLAEVAAHYQHFGGISPINKETESLVGAVQEELTRRDLDLPVYWGNRHWHPFLSDTVRRMAADGVRRALAVVTSAFSSYSGCRQYLEDIASARVEVGEGAPEVDKVRIFYNHPGFIEAVARLTRESLEQLPDPVRPDAALVFTAHSIPLSMARWCDYQVQLEEAAGLVAERLGEPHAFSVAYQSRSGPPSVPWLEPSVEDHLRHLADGGAKAVALVPIGFVADHMEVVYDLDAEAMSEARSLGLMATRVPTVGTAPEFVEMIGELLEERVAGTPSRAALGCLGQRPDQCHPGCCLAPG